MPFYQSIMHGHGFHIPVDGDSPITGFYTGRKVFARNEVEAHAKFKERLIREEKVQRMIYESQQVGLKPVIDIDELFVISPWRYWFGACPKGFICYDDTESPND